MSRVTILTIIVIALIIVILLITVNVTQCESETGPFGFLRFTACEEAPILDPN